MRRRRAASIRGTSARDARRRETRRGALTMSGTGSLSLALGAIPESDFCGRGRIKVVRKGRYHPVYALSFSGQPIADLAWQGPRRILYRAVTNGARYDMKIGPMQRKIR